MAEIVSAVVTTIEIVRACVDKYCEFSAFEDECETFRQSLRNVANVLDGIKTELGNRNAAADSSNTTLRRPLKLLKGAVKEGGKVLKKCSSKKRGKLLAFVFSRQYMGMLNTARADIRESMRLLQFSSVTIQLSTRRMMDNVSERLEELDKKIIAISAGHTEVAQSILQAVQLRNSDDGSSDRDGATASTNATSNIRDALVRVGAASDAQDGAELLAELQKEAESIRQAKVVYDHEILEAVLALTAPRDDGTASQMHGARETTTASAVLECMICPITSDIMLDPVTVVESGITYDRESLCKSLLLYPDLDPASGQRYDRPLRYTPNLAVRSMITAQYGDSYYQRYEDQGFKSRYETTWMQRLYPLSSTVDVLEDPSTGGADETGGFGGVGGGESRRGSSEVSDSRSDIEAGRQYLGEPAPATCGETGSDLPLGDFNTLSGASIAGTAQLPNAAASAHRSSPDSNEAKMAGSKPGTATTPREGAGLRKFLMPVVAAGAIVVFMVVLTVVIL